jgi:hypothetical protein
MATNGRGIAQRSNCAERHFSNGSQTALPLRLCVPPGVLTGGKMRIGGHRKVAVFLAIHLVPAAVSRGSVELKPLPQGQPQPSNSRARIRGDWTRKLCLPAAGSPSNLRYRLFFAMFPGFAVFRANF